MTDRSPTLRPPVPRRVLAALAALAAAVIAVLSATTAATSPIAQAAAPYTVGGAVTRGYTGSNVGLNNYTVRNLGAYAAVGTAGEALPVWCIQAHLSHSTASGGYAIAGSNLVDSGALDYLLWKYRSFDALDGAGEADDRAAAINGLTLFYGRSPRNGNSLLVWQNSLTGATITPANSSGHRWNALPQFSLAFPIGMYDLGARNYDRAEQLTDQLFHEAERLAAPWSLSNTADDAVQLTSASGAPVGGHAVALLDTSGALVGTATTDDAGELTVTDPRVASVRVEAPGVHLELSAGAGAQRLVGGGTPAELVADIAVAWEPVVVTQISTQSAMPFETVTDSLHVTGVPEGRQIDVELELYVLDDDPTSDDPPLTTAVIRGLGNGWTHGHAPYTVLPEHQGARLSYRERWINPATGAHGPWSELGIAEETVAIGRFELATEVIDQQLDPDDETVTDRVSYGAGLDPAAGSWTMSGVAVNRADGTFTEATGHVEFIPDAGGGSVDVVLPAPPAGDYVVFEQLLLDGRPIAEHADLAAESQWFSVRAPEPPPPPEPPATSEPATSEPLTSEPAAPEPPATSEPPPESTTLVTTTVVPTSGGGGGLPSTGSDTTALLMTAAGVTGIGAALSILVQQERELRRRATSVAHSHRDGR